MKNRIIILLLFVSMLSFGKDITIACSDRNWYPFIYFENGQAKGMHIEIIEEAMKRRGHTVEFVPYPIRRALLMAKIGRVDGIASVPYDISYEGVEFPPESENTSGNNLIQEESDWRIMQIDQVVVTYKDGYRFSGGVGDIPSPVRLLFHDQKLIDIIKSNNKIAEPVVADEQNFKKLIRDKNGSLITTTITAEKMYEMPEYKDIIKIHSSPVTSLSYYLGFSAKTNNISKEEKLEIWKEIVNLREDYVYILQLFAGY